MCRPVWHFLYGRTPQLQCSILPCLFSQTLKRRTTFPACPENLYRAGGCPRITRVLGSCSSDSFLDTDLEHLLWPADLCISLPLACCPSLLCCCWASGAPEAGADVHSPRSRFCFDSASWGQWAWTARGSLAHCAVTAAKFFLSRDTVKIVMLFTLSSYIIASKSWQK